MASRRKRKTLYEVLGVAKDADKGVIRKAYRRLARKLHPDVNPGDKAAEERFKQVSEAYSVLSDDAKRRNYDEFGEVSLEGGFDAEAARRAREAFGARFGADTRPHGAYGTGDFESQAFEFGDLDEMLGRVFRGRGRRRAGMSMRGEDVQATLELDFLEAARGAEKRLTLTRPSAEGGAATETVTVRIPAGVADGGRIRLSGKGAPGIGGGPSGDLWATIRVRPHPLFRREGRDLMLEVPLRMSEAVKGAKVEVPTLEGRATVTIPPGTDSGRKLRLRGKGIADPSGGPPGDLYVVVQIRVPRDLDAAALEKLEALEAFEPRNVRDGLSS
jgi:curved DNA-binding protein